MSRVGRKPIQIPDKTTIDYKNRIITVKAEKGTLSRSIHPAVELEIKDSVIEVNVIKNDRKSRALQGLTRSLVGNMVIGVTKGFEKVLEINGIGYRALLKGNLIEFTLGHSHPVSFDLPEGISAAIDKKMSSNLPVSIRNCWEELLHRSDN